MATRVAGWPFHSVAQSRRGGTALLNAAQPARLGWPRRFALRYDLSIMPLQIIKRRSRGFICVNAHPEGCRRNVERWIAGVRGNIPNGAAGPKNVLVIGASTGYGLASRIAAAWGCGAKTLGVFFERPPEGDKTATAGYYNTAAVHSLAQQDGLF